LLIGLIAQGFFTFI